MDFIALSFGTSLTRNLATSALPDAPTVGADETPTRSPVGSGGFRGLLAVVLSPGSRVRHA